VGLEPVPSGVLVLVIIGEYIKLVQLAVESLYFYFLALGVGGQ
jgi:hypothetical protein